MLQEGEGQIVDEKQFRTVVGKIMYLTQKLMVKGINAARELTKYFGCPKIEHWKSVEYFAGFLKKEKEHIRLTYQKPKEMRFVAMVDSNYATDKETRKSISGAIYTVGGGITGWTSKSQKSTALSSSEAEYYAMSLASQELLFVQQLLSEMGECVLPGLLLEDNYGAIQLSKNCQTSPRTKHIDNRHHFMRDIWEERKMDVEQIRSKDNKADICTKNVDGATHERHRENICEGTFNVTKNYEVLVLLPRREDVRKRARDDIRDIKTNTGEEEHGQPFDKKKKISWKDEDERHPARKETI